MDVARTGLIVGLVVMLAMGYATIWTVYVVVFNSGLASVLRETPACTLLPSIVGKDQLDRANGRMITARAIKINRWSWSPGSEGDHGSANGARLADQPARGAGVRLRCPCWVA